PHTRVSLPCSRSGSTVLSATLAGVATTAWISLLRLSTPICAFIPKYHWFPFLVWCISGSRALSAFLVEDGAFDDGRIDNRAGGHLQALRRQVPLHRVEQPPAQIMLLEQMAEAAHRGFVGDRLAPEIDPDEIAHCPRIVERLFYRRVGQVEPLLQKVYSQHPLDSDWW